MRIYVQIEFGQDIESAIEFLEQNELDGRVVMDATPREARQYLDEVRAEDDEEGERPAKDLH